MLRTRPQLGKRLDMAVALTTATGNRFRYASSKNPSENPFSPPASACSQLSETRRSSGSTARTSLGGRTRESTTVLVQPLDVLSEPRALRSLEPEGRQIDDRLFAELHESQAEVRVMMQTLLADFVEDRRASEVVAPLEEQANRGRVSAPRRTPDRPFATHVRPCTPYMTNPVRPSSKSTVLSRR